MSDLVKRLKLQELQQEFKVGLYLKAAYQIEELEAEKARLWDRLSDLPFDIDEFLEE